MLAREVLVGHGSRHPEEQDQCDQVRECHQAERAVAEVPDDLQREDRAQEMNDAEGDLDKLKDVIKQIHPDRVQLNTLDRPGTLQHIRPATALELSRVIKILDFQPIEIIAKVQETVRTSIKRDDIRQAILETIHRRPCTKTDLQKVLGVKQDQVDACILLLEKENKIKGSQQERGMFYQTVKEPAK